MSLDSASVSSVVAEIGALIQEQQGGSEVQKLIQQIAEKATPGADGDYKSSIEEAIAAIEAEVEPKILASHKETQSKLDAALSAFRSQAGGASEALAEAKDVDKTYFECVATEQTSRQAVESAEQSHETAEKAAAAACKAQEEDRSFTFDAAKGSYNFGMDCDLGDAEACQSQMEKLEEAVAKMEKDLTTAMDADQKQYDGLKAVCARKTLERNNARGALARAEEVFSGKRTQCANSVAGRRESMCSFGTELVKKCEMEATFNKLDAASREEGQAMSESDRAQEWKAARTTKCMLQKYMEKGLDGSVNSDLLNACNEGGDEMKLARQDAVAKQLKEGVRCADGPITFASGQAWNVPEGGAPASSSYSKVAFKPAFSLTRGFGFCGKAIGEQNIGGAPEPDARSRPDNCGAYMDDAKMTLRSRSHTVVMALKFGHAAKNTATRQWLLNIGQDGTSAEHWLYTPKTGAIQFGAWNGKQVSNVDISQAQTLATVYDGERKTYALYVDGEFAKEVDGVLLDIKSSSVAVGERHKYSSNANFDGCSSGINIYLSPLTAEQVRATSKALLEESALV